MAAHRLSLVVESGGFSLVAVNGLLVAAAASLVGEHRLQGAFMSRVTHPVI